MILSDGMVLDSMKFNELLLDQETNYKNSLPLRFLNRTETVPADDDEITSYFTGQVYAADIIVDDAKAAVYEAGVLEFVTNTIPNLKVGKRFGQAMISRLARIRRNLTGAGVEGDVEMFTQWETRTAASLIRGVDERKNALICAMMIDALTYDRFGVKITGSWGMPANLKFTPSTLWADPAATPITDILTAKQFAADTYGETYDVITLSTADFRNAVATTEFKQLIAGVVMQPLATTAFNARDPRMQGYFGELIGMRVELEDKIMREQTSAGATVQTRVLPLGKVLLSSAADENDPTSYDFANAVVTESIVASLVGDPDNMPQGEQFGPMGYYTGSSDLNPPNLIAWAVARGFPRKHRKTCTSIITVR